MYLLDRFAQIFPQAQTKYICGDHEFVGKQWLTYLSIEPQIRFRLRIRHSDRISDGKQKLRASVNTIGTMLFVSQVIAISIPYFIYRYGSDGSNFPKYFPKRLGRILIFGLLSIALSLASLSLSTYPELACTNSYHSIIYAGN